MKTITLNRADVAKILKTLDKHSIDYFELIKNDTSGIGYTLDIEHLTKLHGESVTVRIPVVGVEDW